MKHRNKNTFGKSDLVDMIYRVRPDTSDAKVKRVMKIVFGEEPSNGTLATWRFRCRKRGVNVPDGRSK